MSPLVNVVSNAHAASTIRTATITNMDSNNNLEQKEQTTKAVALTINTNKPTDQQIEPELILVRHKPINPRLPTEAEEIWLQTAVDGDIEEMHFLLDSIDNIDCVDRWGSSALMLACYNDHSECVQLLLEEGANIDQQDYRGITCLMETSWNCNVELVTMLLNSALPPDLNLVDDRGYSALMQAAEEGYSEIVALLIENGADVNLREKYRRCSALMLAASRGQLNVVKQLYEGGAQINYIAKRDRCHALLSATKGGYTDVARFLIRVGSDVNIQDHANHYTALMWAVAGGYLTIAEQLITAGCNMDLRDSQGHTALMHAARGGFC